MANNSLSDEDKTLFRQAMYLVKPLKKSKVMTLPPEKSISKTIKPKISVSVKPSELALSSSYNEEVQADSILSFNPSCLPYKRLKELKSGQIHWQAKLDLHGMNADTAEQHLVKFIYQAITANYRCVLLVHGKGSRYGEPPVLKNLVNHWLKQIPQVLAFYSATPKDGGAGALYLLLKNKQKI